MAVAAEALQFRQGFLMGWASAFDRMDLFVSALLPRKPETKSDRPCGTQHSRAGPRGSKNQANQSTVIFCSWMIFFQNSFSCSTMDLNSAIVTG